MLPSRQLVAALCVATVSLAASAHGQETDLTWAAGANGAIPGGAIAFGQESDGRMVYVCRGSLGGTVQLGKLTSGSAGCVVAYGGRETLLRSYEALAHPVRPAPVRKIDPATASAIRDRAAIAATPSPPVLSGGHATVPPTPADSSIKRGFDDHGRPYVEVRLPDGTIKRTQDDGVTLIHPDGTMEFVPNMKIRMDAQSPTPPSLPSNPAQGRAWVERHNADLLDLIKDLVASDTSEMQKFASGEQQAAGDDLFKQIVYRTTIAEFLATAR